MRQRATARRKGGGFSLSRLLAVALAVAATLSGTATYIAITQSSSPFGPDPKTVLALVLVDLALLVYLETIERGLGPIRWAVIIWCGFALHRAGCD